MTGAAVVGSMSPERDRLQNGVGGRLSAVLFPHDRAVPTVHAESALFGNTAATIFASLTSLLGLSVPAVNLGRATRTPCDHRGSKYT